jgi:hypothetical protein
MHRRGRRPKPPKPIVNGADFDFHESLIIEHYMRNAEIIDDTDEDDNDINEKEIEVPVIKKMVHGKTYLMDDENILYDIITHEEIGKLVKLKIKRKSEKA